MIRKLLEDYIKNNVPDNEVAVLLSGGVDSISVGLAAHHVGKKVHAYSFHLVGEESYDFKKARDVSDKMQWEFSGVQVPTDNLVEDWHRLVKLKCQKKTHFECVFPFLYIYPQIEETYVLTGWGADGYFGVSKKLTMRYGSEEKNRKYKEYFKNLPHNIITFDEARDKYFLPDNCAGLKWHNKLVYQYNKIHITPYLDDAIKKHFYQFSWEDLNIPEQKHHIRNDFTEFKNFGDVKSHLNLHLGGGVNKLFETLLNNPDINFNERKRMMDICRDWSNGI